ncbi:MerR family transcriptional regulator [Halomonas huangheensis]|uniref:HTH merR-type domain-containing protein n=1 Tax=Halomonas huangheensis TaxID=1178482 RepID=W1N355_9GAMM|nr:MerR family transcriptional regulator [Halomonas huangheensis]ALM51189.1 MerR family transcriptional regulator [Halomonas huangheensis]ERL49606.1 hypothetical protein BJB45_00375 [Halomonas huangheensis]
MSDTVPPATTSPLYPIREVSRLTGVNSVTLRAWERRYGLITPQRTPKGHRLYSRSDIERIERILQWLHRGVPVSQVTDLLNQPELSESSELCSSNWAGLCRQALAAVDALDVKQLERLYLQAMALYPVTACISELWQPLVIQLEEHWEGKPGAALQRRCLESFFRTRIGIRLYHGNDTCEGPTLLVDTLPDDDGPLWSMMLALAASDRGYRVYLFDTVLPLSELPIAQQRLQTDAIVLCSGKAERTDMIRHQLPRLAGQLDTPLALCGPVARIRAPDLDGTEVITLGSHIPQAVDRLRPLLASGISIAP